MRRGELPTTDVRTIAWWIELYASAGHPIEVEGDHRLDPHDNQLIFRIGDWDAFAAIMEQYGDAKGA